LGCWKYQNLSTEAFADFLESSPLRDTSLNQCSNAGAFCERRQGNFRMKKAPAL
jgi:hypothetical protein